MAVRIWSSKGTASRGNPLPSLAALSASPSRRYPASITRRASSSSVRKATSSAIREHNLAFVPPPNKGTRIN